MIHISSLTIPEIIERAQRLDTNDEKIKYIRMYRNTNLEWFVRRLYSNDIADKGIPVPKFKPCHYPVGMTPMNFKQAIVRFENGCKIREANPQRSENLIMLTLESVTPAEAELFIMILRGKRKFEGISKSVWKGVYPEVFQSASE